MLNYSIGYFLVLYLRSGISGYYGYYLSFGDSEPNEYGVLYLKYSLMSKYIQYFGLPKILGLPEMLGIPNILGNTQHFGLSDTQ